ncbi:MAG TPA: hypothetical protein VMH20_00650 [Verrucomicrobiae bacterium]|nr:hypothetical protein [Verrucomicrobiae bacterium]
MNENNGLLSSGWAMLMRNKRYIFWFWLLNLTLAEFGTGAFRRSAHAILDHSLASGRLVHGFDMATFSELLARPDFGQMSAMTMPAFYFAFLFFLATALLLPGVFEGYAATFRLPRQDFFRACGRNLWRFIRILIIAAIIMGIVAGALFALQGFLVKKAGESTNEILPFETRMVTLAVIFLIMTILRIWFDLAEVETVLNDRNAVRKAIRLAFRHTFRSLPRLVTGYVVAAILAAIILAAGLWFWNRAVGPESILGAFLLAQFILFLLLIPRFWQRAMAVSYWQQHMRLPAAVTAPAPEPVFVQPVPPVPPPPTPDIPPQPQES